MKKFVRWILILGVVLAVLLLVGVGVALNSGVQTSVARHFLQQSDPQAKLESVALGFSNGEVRGLEMSVGGQGLKLGSATIQYSLTNLIFGHTKVIDAMTVKDVVFDASVPAKAPPAKSQSPAAATNGQQGSTPSVLVRQADFSGNVLLPSQRSVQFTLSLQNVGSASAGQAKGAITFLDKSPGASVSQMNADVQASVALDADMQPQNLDVLANLAANLPGQNLPSRLAIHAQGKVVNAGSSNLSLTLGPSDAGAANWVSMLGTCDLHGLISGNFTANLTRAEIEPFAMGFKLPDFNLKGQGQFTADGPKNTASLAATIAGSAANFDVLRPELAGLGQVDLSASIDTAVQPGKSGANSLEISTKTLALTLAPAGGKTAVALELLKPTTVEYDDKGLALPAGAGADLAQLTLTQAPASWLSAVLPKDLSATGQGLNGQITISARDDGAVVANTTQMVTFDGLNVKQGGDTLLDGGALEFDATMQYLAKNLTAQVRRLNFKAHSVAAGGVNLSSVSAQTPVTQELFVGNVTVTPAPGAQVLVNGSLTAALDVDNLDHAVLGKNLPFVAPAGVVFCNSTFDVAATVPADGVKNPLLVVNAFQATVSKGPLGPASTTLATVTALQKFSIPLNKDAVLPAVSGNLATIEANAFPLPIVQPFLPANMTISGNPLKGKILLAGAGGTAAGLTVQTLAPLTIENAGFAQNSLSQFSNVTLTLNTAGSWQSGNLAGSVHLQATSAQGVLVDLAVNATEGPNTMTANVTASGRLGAIAEQPIGVDWRNFLPDPKPEYAISANISSTPSGFTLSSAEARVMPPGGVDAPLADAKLIQPFSVQMEPAKTPEAKPTYTWPKLSGDVASVKLSNLPAGVLALAMPGYLLHGRGLAGDVAVRGSGDGNYTLVTNAPVVADGLTVAQENGKLPPTEWVRNLTFSMKPSATFSSKGVAAWAVADLTLAAGNTPLARGSLDWTSSADASWPQQAKISLQADLAQLLTQPVLAKYDNLENGMLAIDGTMDAAGNLTLNASLSSWAVHDPDLKLPKMVFQNATGKVNRATGALQLTIPIKGEGITGPTDCQVVFGLEPVGASHKFTLNVTGNNLVIDDLLAVQAGLVPPAPTPARPPGAPPPAAPAISSTPDKTPVWGDMQGSAQIQLKTMRFQTFAIDNFAASAQVSPTQAVLSGVSGNFQGAPISLNATLGFNGTQAATPYQLQSNLSFKNFNAGTYFHSRDAQATPPVEGNFTITGAVNGTGANIDDLIDKVQFNFSLGSSSGTFHLLDLVANKAGLSGKTLKNVTAAAGALIGLLGNKVASTAVTQASSVTDLLAALDSIQYNKLVFEAQRGADHNVKLSQFDVQGPTIELTGTGQITYVRGQPIPDQPLTANLGLNAKGTIASAMQTLHLLGGATANGYAQGPQFKVTGTIQKPNYNFLYDLLTQGLGGILK